MVKIPFKMMRINTGIGLKALALWTVLIVVWGHASADDGLVHAAGAATVDETAAKALKVLSKEKMTVFLQMDHAQGARQQGFEVRDMQLILFGNPGLGASLIQCSPTVGIDLPMKLLIWEDLQGNVFVSYNDPGYLADRHEMSLCAPLIRQLSQKLNTIVTAIGE